MSPSVTETRKDRVRRVIFGTETNEGHVFDVILLWLIGLSVAAVMLESVSWISERYATPLHVIEWIFTLIFTIEYGVRLWSARQPSRYAFSFFGIIDLLSVIPTYLTLLISGSHYLMVFRIFRLLRVFRILKMVRHLTEGALIISALKNSRAKITVFLFAILTLAVIMGTVMYMVEGEENGFTSIPVGVYWAIVTLTTVGYGDITPVTIFGKFLSSVIMIMGYAIIAVPTGVVTAEILREDRNRQTNRQHPRRL